MQWIKHEIWVSEDTGFQISKHPQAGKYMILDSRNACIGVVDSLADAQDVAETKAMAIHDASAMAALLGAEVTELAPGIVMVAAGDEGNDEDDDREDDDFEDS